MKWFLVIFLGAAAALTAGQNPSQPVPTPAPAANTDAEGKAIASSACTSCHGDDVITAHRGTRADWLSVIDRMKSYGAGLSAAQSATLLDYLTRTYAPKDPAPEPAPVVAAPDPGKKILEEYCGSCHDVGLATSRTGTQSDWQDVVDRMNGRGAGIPDKDIPILVQYLTKAYGVPK